MEEGNSPAATEQAETPQFFVDQSLTTEYREDGSIDYQFNSEHFDYYKNSDHAEGRMVYFIFFNGSGQSWHSRADQATFFNDSKKIQLRGNVRIWQPTRNLELTTDEIAFNETREYAQTDKPVTIKSTVGVTHSTGMIIDLQQEKLQLLSAVTGSYHVK